MSNEKIFILLKLPRFLIIIAVLYAAAFAEKKLSTIYCVLKKLIHNFEKIFAVCLLFLVDYQRNLWYHFMHNA